ncbi:MAG: tripartite tricarboxylate transporter TctB family protein [Pseudolabrys sp.]
MKAVGFDRGITIEGSYRGRRIHGRRCSAVSRITTVRDRHSGCHGAWILSGVVRDRAGRSGLGRRGEGLRAKVIDPIPSHKIEPLFLMILSIVSFGLLIDRAGLVVATFVCLFFACFRRVFTNPIEVFLTYSVLTIFNILVFIYAFGMTIPIFWWEN